MNWSQEIAYLLWSIIPALVIGFGTGSIFVGAGVLIVMFFITSLDKQVREISKNLEKKDNR